MGFKESRRRNGANFDAYAGSTRALQNSLDQDPIETGAAIRIDPTGVDTTRHMSADDVPHVVAQFVLEGRAQVAEFAAQANAAIREPLSEARAARFEAVQQAKARRLMLESYRAALTRHAMAQQVLGPHVRFHGFTGKSLWVACLLLGDAAAMTLALTYGGESPFIAAIFAVAVGAAVIIIGKTADDLRRVSLSRTLTGDDPEAKTVVDAVFGVTNSEHPVNNRMHTVFAFAAVLATFAVIVYRTSEESFALGLAFGLWTLLISLASFANSWYYCDPAKTFISLSSKAVRDAETIWRSHPIDAIEDHNRSIEAARHIVSEFRRHAEANWHLVMAGASAAVVANPQVFGVSQPYGHSLLTMGVPEVDWPSLTEYVEIVDPDDVLPLYDEDEDFEFDSGVVFADDDATNRIVRPADLRPTL
ncbi:MAG: hypothetical protein ACKOBT_10645 [Actinomycetota bacterium]